MLMDFVGRFENFEKDVRKVLGSLSITCDRIPHELKGRRGPYKRYYNDESREMVAEMYAEDMKLFGYRF